MSCSSSYTEVLSSSQMLAYEEFPMMRDLKSLSQLEKYDDDLSEIIRSPSTIPYHIKGDKNQVGTTASGKSYVASVDRNDLNQISLIGSGQFCNVYSVTGILSQPWQCESQGKTLPRKRSLLAFKSIDPTRVRNTDDLVVAAIDLANEAQILSQLDHKHIIRLRGISKTCFSQSFFADGDSGGNGFFLVLDILKETLAHRLQYWRKNSKSGKYAHRQNKRNLLPLPSSLQKSSSLQVVPTSKATRRSHLVTNAEDCHRDTMYNRIENIAFGIAEGMEYLHSQQIVLRDLKPSNIGFDFETGTQIRLFDFGMARRVTECVSDEICGSPKYMAPEVMSGKGYSLKVDAYSFGVVLYEICSLHAPYADNYWNKEIRVHNRKNSRWSKLKKFGTKNKSCKSKQVEKAELLEDFFSHVVENQLRPFDDLNSIIPCLKIRALIHDCWSNDPDDRPPFTEILSRLEIIFNRQ